MHIISHCPYLIAQYFKYKGRDVHSTVRALLDVGYPPSKLIEDIMRFPSMLSAPPDRIRGWQSLLDGYDVARKPGLFWKLLKKAPFMFYVNPPAINDIDLTMIPGDASATASGFVAYEALKVLGLVNSLRLSDMDKVIRTQPMLLLENSEEVNKRINFLLNLFLENSSASSPSALGSVITAQKVDSSSWARLLETEVDPLAAAQQQLSGIILTYPAILSIGFEYVGLKTD